MHVTICGVTAEAGHVKEHMAGLLNLGCDRSLASLSLSLFLSLRNRLNVYQSIVRYYEKA